MALKKKLRVAVIGCGRIGAFTVYQKGDGVPKSYYPQNHCQAIKSIHGLELIALCDTDQDNAKRAGELHEVKKIYTDYKKMLREENPDIVAIATRAKGRAEMITYLANHGVKAIHTEKPFALNLRDTLKATKALDKNGVGISYGTVRRYMPVFNQAKKILDSGKLGKLQKVVIDISKSQLLWSHPHCIDLLNFYTGRAKVKDVEATYDYNPADISTNVVDMDPVINHCIINYKNGMRGVITDTNKNYVLLNCEKGDIAVDISGNYIKTGKMGRLKKIKIKPGLSGRCNALIELRDYINKGKQTSLTTEDILDEEKIILAIGKSGAIKKKVRPEDIGQNFTITGKYKGLYP